MTRLSAAIVAQDEAARLPRCLAALASCDEIVVVDGGSVDDTVRLARAAGARVVERPFTTWAEQREAARQACAGEWVLSVDADEVVSEALAREIALALDGPHAAYAIPFANHLAGVQLRHGGFWPDRHVRLFRRDRARWDPARPVHERLVVDGTVGRLASPVLHYTYDSMAHALAKTRRYADAAAQSLHARGRRGSAMSLAVKPAWRFFRAFVLRRGFLDGAAGARMAWLRAYEAFRREARLRELGRSA